MGDKFSIVIPDNEYWKKQVKCQYACPVGTDARGYVIAIAEGRFKEAYAIARGPNPFASICGRVCGAHCEANCRRGSLDESVSIRALKRFATEMHGVESHDPGNTIELSTARRDTGNPKAGTKIAIIGAGVAGLTAAHDLALLGYDVTLFESGNEPGGMLIAGLPVYRLPRELVRQEIDAILNLGITLKLNMTIGKDITIEQLHHEGYKAVLIAAGLQKSRAFPIEGIELEGAVHGIEFLKRFNLGQTVKMGKKVAVIGGGNVAMDAARTAVRLGAEKTYIVYRRSMEEIPARSDEVHHAQEEGIDFQLLCNPVRLIGGNGSVESLECIRMELGEPDESGRRSPVPVEGSEFTMDVDTVIFAVGQEADFDFLNGIEKTDIAKASLVNVDKDTKQSKIPHIFACGDIAEGAGLLIDAIASGQKAARSIDEYIRGSESVDEEYIEFNQIKHRRTDGYLRKRRENPPVIDAGLRISTMSYVEENYSEKTARDQAERCLRCHVNTIFLGERCLLCGGCVDVCPMNCLKLVKLSDLNVSGDLEKLINNYYGIDFKKILNENGDAHIDAIGSVMIKDEEICIRCGFCAKRCPSGAITMEQVMKQTECIQS